jgi:hypothetical protein
MHNPPHAGPARGTGVVPEHLPLAGLMILHDRNPAKSGVTLSPVLYHYQHRPEFEVLVRNSEDRNARFDRLIDRIRAVITATAPCVCAVTCARQKRPSR